MFAKPSEAPGGGNFFKPADLSTSLAVVFEPKSVVPEVTHTYQGKVTGVHDDVVADITVFDNQAMLDGTTSPITMKQVTVDKKGVANALKHFIGGAVLGRLTKDTTKNGNTVWVLVDVDPQTTEKVGAYFTARAEAAAAAPSFD
jgi:hypothetical protein